MRYSIRQSSKLGKKIINYQIYIVLIKLSFEKKKGSTSG